MSCGECQDDGSRRMIRSLKPLVAILLAVQGTAVVVIFFRFTHCYFVCNSFCWLDFYVTEEKEEATRRRTLRVCKLKRIGVLILLLIRPFSLFSVCSLLSKSRRKVFGVPGCPTTHKNREKSRYSFQAGPKYLLTAKAECIIPNPAAHK